MVRSRTLFFHRNNPVGSLKCFWRFARISLFNRFLFFFAHNTRRSFSFNFSFSSSWSGLQHIDLKRENSDSSNDSSKGKLFYWLLEKKGERRRKLKRNWLLYEQEFCKYLSFLKIWQKYLEKENFRVNKEVWGQDAKNYFCSRRSRSW